MLEVKLEFSKKKLLSRVELSRKLVLTNYKVGPHRHKCKKKCEKCAAELYDEELFLERPPVEDCTLYSLLSSSPTTFESYCGKRIFNGIAMRL